MEHITVCVCTYKRPWLLQRLFEELRAQRTDGLFSYSIVVADNDREESAKEAVTNFAATCLVKTVYCVEPVANIARARNKVVSNAEGDYLAFIDDDEFPGKDWLLVMWKALNAHKVDGVLAPVLPFFEPGTPQWIVKAGFYDRARHETGFVMGWQECRTGNVLIRRRLVEGIDEVFNPEFGAQGEDQDFFRRMIEKGCKFIWCDEAPAYEVVPPHRCERRFLLKRALLRGTTTFRHRRNLAKNLVKSLIAVPLYALALPFLLILGHHYFMRYLVRLCDHLGRLLAVVNLNPVKERTN